MKTHQPKSTPDHTSERLPQLNLTQKGGALYVKGVLTVFAAALCIFGLPAAKAASFAATNIWLGTGADTLWTTTGNWNAAGVPVDTSLVILTNFGPASATGLPGTNGMGAVGTPNITIASDTRVAQLWFCNSNLNNTLPSYHTIGINPGVTLTVSNNVANLRPGNSSNIVQVSSTAGFPSLWGLQVQDVNETIYATVQGAGGTLNVICTNGLTQWWQGNFLVEEGSLGLGGANDPLMATLDLSGLDNFNAYVNRLCVAADANAGGYFMERPSGTFYLAKTNLITLWTAGTFPNEGSTHGIIEGLIAQNNGGGLSRSGRIFLGLTNGIFSDNGIGLGLRGCSGFIGFNTNNPQGGCSAYFRNKAGTGRQSLWSLGDRTGTASGNNQNVKGEMNFSQGTVDAMVSTLRIGVGAVTTLSSIGSLEFGAGVIDVNTLQLGCQNVAATGPAQGTIIVSNTAVLKINTSALLGFIAGSQQAGSYFGQIIITNGGTVQFANTAPLTCGTATSEIDLANGGALSLATAGTPAAPLTTLTVSSNNTLTVDLGALPNPSVAPIQVSTLNSAGNNVINILGTGLIKGTIALIKYGTWNNDGTPAPCINFAMGTNSPGVVGYITNNVANGSIDFVVTTGTATSLVWDGQVGGVPNGAWDINLTPDWQSAQKYTQVSIPGSLVQFDDTATGTTTVTISNNLAPVLMIVTNASKTYTFTGTGTNALSGPGKLVKDGSGLMILNNTGTNSGTGEIDINNGTLQIGGSDNRLPVGATVVLANSAGATLDLNNFNQTLATISGGGTSGGTITEGAGNLSITGSGTFDGVISGSGALFKKTGGTLKLTGANLYSGGTVVSNGTIVVANTTGSGLGSGSLFIAGGSVQLGDGLTANGSIAASVITNNGALNLLPQSDYTLSTFITGSGGVTKQIGAGSATIYITNDNNYTGGTSVSQGRLQISSSHALGSGAINCGNQTVDDTWLALSGGITVTNAFTLSAKTGGIIPAVDQIKNADSTNTITGNILLAGSTAFAIGSDAGKLVVAGNLINSQVANPGRFFLRGAGDGEFRGAYDQAAGNPLTLEKYDSGTWTLSGTNTYTGFTAIVGGKLTVNGAIQGSSWVNVGYTTSLAGSGKITAPVTNIGTIFPGDDSILGTLTISNTLFCDGAGTTVFDVSTNGNDQIRGLSQVTYGGTLQVVVGGTLTGNCVFKLFSANAYVGTFDTYSLPDINPLVWDTSYLAVDGTLHVTNGVTVTPTITSVAMSGGNLVLNGIGTLVAPYDILATTNLTLPLGSWTDIGSGTFSNGVFSFIDVTATNYPSRFYRLTTPVP